MIPPNGIPAQRYRCPCGQHVLTIDARWESVGVEAAGQVQAAGVAQGAVDPALAAKAQEIIVRLGGVASDEEFVVLVRSALAESAAGVEACVAKVEQAQAAGRVSNASGLLIKMLRDHDHRKLGQPAGERCLLCDSTDTEDYSRFGGPRLCAHHAETASVGSTTFAELAAAEAAPG